MCVYNDSDCMGVEGVYREGQGHCDLSSNDSIGEYFLLRFNHC